MNVLIAGACEHTGRCLADFLADNTDHEIYAVIQNEEQIGDFNFLNQERVTIKPSDSLIAEMDTVVYAGGCDVKTNDRRVIDSVLNDTKALIDASVRSGVKSFILLSAMGADDPQGSIEDYLYMKRVAEDYLKNSGINFTIIRAGEIAHKEPSGKVNLKENIHWIDDTTISCADLAKVISASLDSDRIRNKTVELSSGDTAVEDAVQKI